MKNILRFSAFSFGLFMLSLLTACAKTTEAEGTWRTDCKEAGRAVYLYQELVFTGSEFVTNLKYFSDSGCSTLTLTESVTATFTIGEAVATPAGAKKLDLTYSSVTATPATDETVDSLNTSSSCGYSDWAKGQAKDTSGKGEADCLALSENAKGDTVFTIFQIDGTKIQFGDLGAPSSATSGEADDKRPTALDSFIANKQ